MDPVPPLDMLRVPPILLRVKFASTASTVGLPDTPVPLEIDIFDDPAVSVLPAKVPAPSYVVMPDDRRPMMFDVAILYHR